MKRLLCIAFGMLVVAQTAMAANSWTLLFYMVPEEKSATHMEDASIRHMQAMLGVGAVPGVTVLVQQDRGPVISSLQQSTYPDVNERGAVRYEIANGKWNIVERKSEVNSGDPKVLYDFIDWGMQRAPADQYMLVIISHGSGILSWRGTGSTSSGRPGEVQLNLSRYVAYDDTNNDCLTVFELAKVLETIGTKRGKALEVVTIDSCLPISVEALFHLRKSCQVLVGSPSEVIIGKFDYATPLRTLASNPGLAPEELGRSISKAFIDNGQSGSQALSVFRTAGAEEIQGAVDRMAMEMIRAYRETGKLSMENITLYELADMKMYWDLQNIATRLADPKNTFAGATNATELRQAATDVLKAIQATRVQLWYTGEFASNKTGGLSIFWPTQQIYGKYRSYYKALDFANQTHWDEFLDTWLKVQ